MSNPKPTFTEICDRYRITNCNKTPPTHSPCSIDHCPLTMCNRVQEREESKLIMYTRASIARDKDERENSSKIYTGKVSITDLTGENGNSNNSSNGSNSNMVRINKTNEKSELNRMLSAVTNLENKNKKKR